MATSADHPHPPIPNEVYNTSPTLIDTPNLSGPSTPRQGETPHTVHLQTPHSQIGSSSSSRMASPTGQKAWEGHDLNGKGKGRALDPPSIEDDNAVDVGHLRRLQIRLREIEANDRLGDGWSQRDELLGMVKSVLPISIDHIPFLQERLVAQKDTIQAMQQQAKLSEQLTIIERSRHQAEKDSWHAETRALLNVREAEIAAGTRPRKLLDLDVGYHQELEAANKRLEMDNRLMAPRLADTQRQIDKLVTELRLLRSQVLINSHPIAKAGDQIAADPLPTMSHQPGSAKPKSRSPTKLPGKTTMGDARAEHLLLAARRIRTLRESDDTVGRLTLEELKKNGVVGPNGGLGYSEGYAGVESEAEDEFSEEDEKPTQLRRASMSTIAKTKGKVSQPLGTPLLPRPKKVKRTQPTPMPQTPSKSNRKQHPPPQTTPGGSNFNDLLRAAEMATRPGTPTPEERSQIVPLSAMSATRSTTRVRDDSASERGSPVKRIRRDDWSPTRQDDLPLPTQQTVPESQGSASALDLLAQASQLEVAQSGELSSSSSSGPLHSAARLGGLIDSNGGERSSSPARSVDEMLGPAIDLTPYSRPVLPVEEVHLSDPTLSTPKNRPRAYSGTSDLATPMTAREYASSTAYPTPGADREIDESEFASPMGGGGVPGLGKYVHLTSSMPARRIRSPYLKWTVEEDELLARAVALHGEKWDLVSKGVPTRSYHQVRQRWLRKTGAFDKKPNESGNGIMGDIDEDDSPTPEGGRTPSISGGKHKRRMSQV
ncbi:uncharacterized protein IL334_000313 [Kwoniella shivajii]|uniref:Myb-like domain-containing protein n=1 Tax=Kwoniella shivajii TaxID=564305 RepID=A0ABZ1CNY7_9TREE|nr:hypothetical protein IL334_000313 [Kwoniella shivajii]